MPKSILVTGGTGFIGRSLVRRLLQEGARVRVLDNDWRGAKKKLADIHKDIQFEEADIRDESRVRSACRGIDMVVHLAYVNGTKYFYTMPDLVLEVGVMGIMNTIRGAIHHNVPEFVTASSSEVYQSPPKVPTDETAPLVVPDPLNPRFSYGGGKILSELVTFNFGRKYFKRAVVFRPHNVYGPDMGWEHVIPQFVLRMRHLANSEARVLNFPIQGSGRETRAFIYIDDFTDGLIRVLSKGKHLNIYHIGTTEERSIRQVAEQIAFFYGRDIRFKSRTLRKGGTLRRAPDIRKLEKLGFKPVVSFKEGLLRTLAWYDWHADQVPPKFKKEIYNGV